MMHDCEDGDMRDLLPGYVNDTLAADDRARVAAHLRTCSACADEIALIEAASRAYPAPKVEISKIVRALPSAPRGGSRPFFATRIGQLAAAVGIMAVGALSVLALRGWFGGTSYDAEVGGRALASNDTARSPHAVVPDSPAVTTARPPARAATAAPARSGSGLSFGGGLSDLTDDQLDTLLSELGALDALPAAEPETHLTPIVPEADGDHSAR